MWPLALLAWLLLAGAVSFVATKLILFASSLQEDLDSKTRLTVLEDPTSIEPVAAPSIFSPATKALSIIVPAYNEESRLGSTLEEALSYLQRRRNRQGPHFTYEVIVVDDGSKDATVRVAREYVREHGFDTVRLLRVIKNRGKGHAVRQGMSIARGEFCLFMDADGATRFTDLERLETELSKSLQPGTKGSLAEGPIGAALGSRAHLQKAAMSKRSPLRNFLMKGFHFLVTFVAGSRIRDTQCGFKLFTRRAAAMIFPNQRLQRWCFDVEIVYLADQLGIPMAEVPVEWTEMPGSKIRPMSIVSMAFELLTVKVAYQILGLWKVSTEAELHHKRA